MMKDRGMNSKYDVYKKLHDDRLLWVNRVKEIEEARQLVAAMESVSIDQYLVYDFRERIVVEVFEPPISNSRGLAA
jgi:hypothetical protein